MKLKMKSHSQNKCGLPCLFTCEVRSNRRLIFKVTCQVMLCGRLLIVYENADYMRMWHVVKCTNGHFLGKTE